MIARTACREADMLIVKIYAVREMEQRADARAAKDKGGLRAVIGYKSALKCARRKGLPVAAEVLEGKLIGAYEDRADRISEQAISRTEIGDNTWLLTL